MVLMIWLPIVSLASTLLCKNKKLDAGDRVIFLIVLAIITLLVLII